MTFTTTQPAVNGRAVLIAQVIALIAVLSIWEWAAASGAVSQLFIGRPSGIFKYLVENFSNGTIPYEAMWTMGATLMAFMLGSAAGIACGLLFTTFPATERFFDPLFSGLNALPRIALAPLLLLWFGLGIASKVALGFSLTFFVVLYNTVAGARSVDRDFLILSETLGCSGWERFLKVTLPSAIPTIFSGLKLGLISALLGVVGGEIIASEHGLGQLLTFLAGTFNTNGVFAILAVLGVIGSLLISGMTSLERHLLRWK